jgi:hypothetical protein
MKRRFRVGPGYEKGLPESGRPFFVNWMPLRGYFITEVLKVRFPTLKKYTPAGIEAGRA